MPAEPRSLLLRRLPGAPPWWAAAGAAILLVLVTMDVLHQGMFTSLDHVVSRHVAQWDLRDHGAKPLIYVLTLFGQRGTVLGVSIPLVAYLTWRHRSVDTALRYVLVLVLMTLVVYVVKDATQRTAPVVDLLHAGGASYPSGHICNAMLTWGLLWWSSRRVAATDPAAATQILAQMLNFVRLVGPVAVVVGMTLLDYHWISDFAGGACVAVVLLWIVLHPGWSVPARYVDSRLFGSRRSSAR